MLVRNTTENRIPKRTDAYFTEPEMSIPVYFAKAADYRDEELLPALDKLLAPLIEKLGGAAGKSFMLKPNLLSYRKAEDVSSTHPRVIVGCAKWLFDHGAARVALIENPGTQDTPAIIHAMGIYDELTSLGATVANCSRYAMIELAPEAKCRRMELATEFRDFDAVIDLAKAKTHAMMEITLSVKNLFGLVRGSERIAWHLAAGKSYPRFADMLIDIALTVKPRINLVDAVICMEGNGPGSGEPTFRGFLAGAETPFSLDAALAPLLGAPECPQLAPMLGAPECPQLGRMRERGLRPETEIVGEVPECPPLRMPERENPLDMSRYIPGFIAKWLQKSLVSHPEVNATRCIGCGLCARVCPPKTLTLNGKFPKFELKTCIRCYCCQEYCPQGAIVVRRTVMMKIAGRLERVLRRVAGWFNRRRRK